MRYYWGLGIGHTYSHTRQASSSNALVSVPCPNHEDNSNQFPDTAVLEELDATTGDEPEFSLENREDDCLPDEEFEEDDLAANNDGDVDLGAYQEMYG